MHVVLYIMLELHTHEFHEDLKLRAVRIAYNELKNHIHELELKIDVLRQDLDILKQIM